MCRPLSRHVGMWRVSPTLESPLRPPTRDSNLPPAATICGVQVHLYDDPLLRVPLAPVSTPANPPPATTNVIQRLLARRALGARLLEVRDQSIAEYDRVSERLHRQRTILHARKTEEVRARPERQNQIVVRQVVAVGAEAVRHPTGALTAEHFGRRSG